MFQDLCPREARKLEAHVLFALADLIQRFFIHTERKSCPDGAGLMN